MVLLTPAAVGPASQGEALLCRVIRTDGVLLMGDAAKKRGACRGAAVRFPQLGGTGGLGAANDREGRLLELLARQPLLQPMSWIEEDTVLDRGFGSDLDP